MALKKTTLHLHTEFKVGDVDPRIFGGFLEHLGRAVYGGVHDPQSVHADENGCRKDVLAALKRLDFTAMRYPGGNFVSGYHWQDAVGPRQDRPVTRDLAWHSIETNQFGPNEFLDLCRQMGWTPMLAVNLGTGTPEEARNWLEYCNASAGTKWADLRVAHGYPEPQNVRLWCLGNEMDGPWQIGHMPAEQYAILARQTARLMKMSDPTIEVVACGSCGSEMPTFLDWDRTVLQTFNGDLDYLSIHSYAGNLDDDTMEFLAFTNGVDRQIEATDSVCKNVQFKKPGSRRAFISFDEWNVWYRARHGEHLDGADKFAPPLLEEIYNLEDALVVASYLNSFIRHADSVRIANIAQIVNVIAPVLTIGDNIVLQAIFYPFEMFSRRRSGMSLQVSVDGPSYTTKKQGLASYIDASAILDGDKVNVFVVNRDAESPAQITLSLNGNIASLVSGEVLTGPDAKAINDLEHPNRVSARPHDDVCIKDGRAIIQLPALSVYAGTFRREQ